MAEEPNRLIYESRVYSEQLRLLEGEVERISMTAVELSNSLVTIEGLGHGESLVPIGGGALVNAKIASTDVLLPIGSGYMVAMKKEEAEAEVKKRIKSTETAIIRLRTEFERVNAKLMEVNSKVDAANPKFKSMG